MDNHLTLLTEYFVRENNIDKNRDYSVEMVPARNLICGDRFDLMAKWIYIDAYEKKQNTSIATHIYMDNINAFSCGTFSESGTEEKNTFSKYVECFEELIEDIKKNGFNPEKSLIPVGANNTICDGAHRVAVAAYFNKNVWIIRFPQLVRNYDYIFFRRRLMCDISMGYMAINYARVKDESSLLSIILVKRKLSKKELSHVCDYGTIIYDQKTYLSAKIRKMIFRDDRDRIIKYKGGVSYYSYLYEFDNIEAFCELKTFLDKNRKYYYISKKREETIRVAELIYDYFYGPIGNVKIPFSYKRSTKEKRNETLIRREMYGFGDRSYLGNELRWLKRKTQNFVKVFRISHKEE